MANKYKGPGEQAGQKQRLDEPDDVEGHAGNKNRAPEGYGNKNRAPEGYGTKTREAGDDDDVEGHSGNKNRTSGE
ncbi:MAG: hypothetical protein ACXWQ6_02475 [Candidatus Limnocylindrales bacterium]